MPLIVVLLHPRQPGLDLADPETQLAADPEAPGAAALTAQVVDRLNAHLEVRAQLGQGEAVLDQLKLRAERIGARSGRGVHEQQVRQPHHARSRDSEKPRWIDRVGAISAE